MDANSVEEILKIAGPLLAPVLVGLVKKIMDSLGKTMPFWAKPIMAAIFGGIIAALENWNGGIVAGAGLGLAGVKVRDFAVGKPHSSALPDK